MRLHLCPLRFQRPARASRKSAQNHFPRRPPNQVRLQKHLPEMPCPGLRISNRRSPTRRSPHARTTQFHPPRSQRNLHLREKQLLRMPLRAMPANQTRRISEHPQRLRPATWRSCNLRNQPHTSIGSSIQHQSFESFESFESFKSFNSSRSPLRFPPQNGPLEIRLQMNRLKNSKPGLRLAHDNSNTQPLP